MSNLKSVLLFISAYFISLSIASPTNNAMQASFKKRFELHSHPESFLSHDFQDKYELVGLSNNPSQSVKKSVLFYNAIQKETDLDVQIVFDIAGDAYGPNQFTRIESEMVDLLKNHKHTNYVDAGVEFVEYKQFKSRIFYM